MMDATATHVCQCTEDEVAAILFQISVMLNTTNTNPLLSRMSKDQEKPDKLKMSQN